ncbi:MAG TPA: OPT/YSL family transporter [Verrucomicrobiae bacterium]|nr:OPT/YSL family transporter [Verrucomicrobiae bacterium]
MEHHEGTSTGESGLQSRLRRILPPINTSKYHVLLAAVAILILGPLGGIAAAYMNFSIGFFVGGQVLAGILGSAVTYGYGPEGKHGANYMQSMAASVAGMSGMAVLVQAMVWLGLPQPPVWELILFFLCVGMFGVGVGMLYTPILVDRMQLTFPSGLAVANILRALTDPALLRRSIAKLGGGALAGLAGGVAGKIPVVGAWADKIELSTSTFGAGMIVGARIGLPCAIVAIVGLILTPTLRAHGLIGPKEQFRHIAYIVALGAVVGAALVDLTGIAWEAAARLRSSQPASEEETWKKMNTGRLVAWVVFWGVTLTVVATQILHQPFFFVAFGIGLVFIFLMINGISDGISDWNPISTAFVMAVILMALLGLKDPGVGLFCAAILMLSCGVGVDMQQDRSTGWRLGTNRIIQFRYQVIGIVVGAVMAVALAKVFMAAYPVLRQNVVTHPELGSDRWQSAMTLKIVGSLDKLAHPNPLITKGLLLGIAIGLVVGIIRKTVKGSARYQAFAQNSSGGRAFDFLFDAVLMPSPYAAAFGGFVTLSPALYFGGGGVASSLWDWLHQRRKIGRGEPAEGELPSDMSTTSLVGGGLIAGDSLAALGIGIASLLQNLF